MNVHDEDLRTRSSSRIETIFFPAIFSRIARSCRVIQKVERTGYEGCWATELDWGGKWEEVLLDLYLMGLLVGES
jgi:hypothetical protein